jgi:hypothetical protein
MNPAHEQHFFQLLTPEQARRVAHETFNIAFAGFCIGAGIGATLLGAGYLFLVAMGE